ncbi:universal stress protein [Rufibacter roseus]|uniref:Universal stress protein n=1 Tax=Rufibacter roseus TaxID=1567108 RepID=A0ABW2DR01_9BACT|nr:universal stress protein [Rufibacter roseus]
MMKTIAVLTDFSDEARHATTYAIELAQALEAKLVFVHAGQLNASTMGTSVTASGLAWSDPNIYNPATVEMDEERLRDEERRLNDIVSEVRRSVAPDQLVEAVFLRGVGTDVILDYLEQNPVGLVVMGTKGAQSSLDRWIGTNTGYIMDKAPCPVLAVPRHSNYTGLKKIVFAADPHHEVQWHIEELTTIANTFGAEVTVLYVQEHEGEQKDEDRWLVFSQKMELQAPTFKFARIFSGDLARSIEEYAQSKNADMLIVAKQHRSYLENLFHTSTTERLAHDSVLPLLSLPAVEEGKARPDSIFTR